MKSFNIIIADRDNVSAMITKNLIQDSGHRVLTVVSTEEDLLEAFNVQRPDYLIMGIKLKGTTNVINTARKILEKNNIEIIFITDPIDINLIKKLRTLKSVRIIIKPYSRNELVNTLNIIPGRIKKRN